MFSCISGSNTLRLYAHCAKDRPFYVTIFGLNVSSQKVHFTLDYKNESSNVIEDIYQYELTAPGGNLLSKNVCLNGVKIKDPDPSLPDLLPKLVDGFNMEPYSFSFWTVPASKGSPCY